MTTPAYHQHEEFRNRTAKLAEIRNLGMDPFPPTYTPEFTIAELTQKYDKDPVGHSEDASAGVTPEVSIAGRLVLFRGMGKNAFAHIQDSTGRMQIMCNRELTKVTGYSDEKAAELSPMKFIEKKIDLGDIVGVRGNIFRTHTGELTILVKEFTLLCKTLLPLPDKHSGLTDKGVRYRKRWLDLITHPEVVEVFKLRTRILYLVRRYFEKHKFLEVETPVLQNVYGGAAARPFTTKLNALEQEMYLRISLEIPLKKLIVGGIPRVFEMGKVFRNEGIDRTHNPEFTELEAYMAYADYNDMMVLTENLFEEIAKELFGTTQLSFKIEDKDVVIDIKAPWKRISMKDSIKVYGGYDIDALSDEQMRSTLKEKAGLDPKELQKANRGALTALFFEEFAEEHLIQPHHIIDHPIETTPLCKLHRDPELKKQRIVERFESFILGGEFCNSYTELNDPELQRHLLEEQGKMKEAGDEEAHPLDEEFIEAICQGMPPTGGLGIGIDRMVMLFTGVQSIRDVLYFPIMRPEE